jgi:hypothetical protein
MEKVANTNHFTIALNSKMGTIALAMLERLLKPGLQARKRLWNGWIASPGQFDFQVIIEGPQSRQILAFYASQSDTRSLKQVYTLFP